MAMDLQTMFLDILANPDSMGELPELEPLRVLTPRTEARERALQLALVDPDEVAAWESCEAGNDAALHQVQQLIQSGRRAANLTHCLQMAASSGNESLVAKLLAIGIRFDERVLRIAIDKCLLDTLSLFLAKGWDINEESDWCTPPLLSYAMLTEASDSVISWFLDHGADPNATCKAGLTPLSIAVLKAPLGTVQKCLDRCVQGTVFKGQLLHNAARRNDHSSVQVVELVLRRCGCNVNSIEWEDNAFTYANWKVMGLGTSLHAAAQGGNAGVVKLLLREGADISLIDSRGMTAIQVAEENGNTQVVQLLRDAEYGDTASDKAKI